jgi:adenylate cyclase
MSNPYLQWLDNNHGMQRLEVVDKVFIGREWKGIDATRRIVVNHLMVSREHAMITFSDSNLQITDMSKNGTWVNGIHLTSGSFRTLNDGDVIRVGDTLIRVSYLEPVPSAENDKWLKEETIIVHTEVYITNVVADVRGFSSFSQNQDSFKVYALMKEIFERFCTIVHDFNGAVKDYAGDAVFAFWDHQSLPVKKHAVLACQAAIEQEQALNIIRQKLHGKNPVVENLQMGWGITTGKATMSHYGSKVADLALVGDCINLAFRLSGLANKDLSSKIVICSQTADLIRDKLSVVDLGLVSTRGRKGQEHVYGLKYP